MIDEERVHDLAEFNRNILLLGAAASALLAAGAAAVAPRWTIPATAAATGCLVYAVLADAVRRRPGIVTGAIERFGDGD
jgi:hypothetical protein